MATTPLLSIGMIFKNEERCIERCLKSLEPLREAIPCELIMADTGATDKSREIAERYADQVFDFEWIDDFAAARNAVMERCTGKWYFSVDCDEWLDADISELLAFLQDIRKDKKNVCHAFVIQRNYESPEPEKSEAYDDFRAMRLLRMSTGQRYRGVIHEHLGYQEPAERLTHTILHHDGYVYTNTEEAKKKMRRNMKLLRQILEKDPENLRCLLQCIESGKYEAEYVQYIRRAVAVVQERKDQWETYGAQVLRHAVYGAYSWELSERDEWTDYAEKTFPDSIFTKIDLSYFAFMAAHEEKKWEKAIRYGEKYRAGIRLLRAKHHSQKMEDELGHSSLLAGNASIERSLLVGLADSYLQNGQGKKALEILTELNGEKCDPEHLRITVVAFCQLHAQTILDIAPAFAAFYEQISRKVPDRQRQQARLSMFDAIAAVPFTKKYRKDEKERDNCRPAYTAFLALADQCEAGRAAAIMTADSPEEMWAVLEKVENWQALPIEALEHALQAGVAFPLPEKPLNAEILDGLASRMTHDENIACQMAAALSDVREYPDRQSLYWAQALVLAALRTFDWSLCKEEKSASSCMCPERETDSDTKPAYTPSDALALVRCFARIEFILLPALYTPQALTEENAVFLPPMHRWGLYCTRAMDALDNGNPQEYLSILRKGLKACPGEKDMIQFLLDRFMDDARPKVSPELLALAEKVRAILSAYDPDNPAVAAIRESSAYKQVAWIIEPPPVGQFIQ